ncbi:MAG: hypothetical protein H7308_06450 [Chthonomonadaceae bacterium]|nr:hypothetical protein [Chthonomonadaceae bacterium]
MRSELSLTFNTLPCEYPTFLFHYTRSYPAVLALPEVALWLSEQKPPLPFR